MSKSNILEIRALSLGRPDVRRLTAGSGVGLKLSYKMLRMKVEEIPVYDAYALISADADVPTS